MTQQARTPVTNSGHCGAVRLEVSHRYGALWSYYRAEAVKVIASGPEALTAHAWGDKSLKFQHCRTCGCVVYHEPTAKHDPEAKMGVNARLMDPEDIAGVRVRRLDGAAAWKYLN